MLSVCKEAVKRRPVLWYSATIKFYVALGLFGADLRLHWAHMPFCWFCLEMSHMWKIIPLPQSCYKAERCCIFLYILWTGSKSQVCIFITKTSLYIFAPLKPHFYIVKLGFTGVYIISLIFAQNIDCGYSLEPPCRGGSNEYPQSTFWAKVWKISEFCLNFFNFWRWNFLYIWIGVFS